MRELGPVQWAQLESRFRQIFSALRLDHNPSDCYSARDRALSSARFAQPDQHLLAAGGRVDVGGAHRVGDAAVRGAGALAAGEPGVETAGGGSALGVDQTGAEAGARMKRIVGTKWWNRLQARAVAIAKTRGVPYPGATAADTARLHAEAERQLGAALTHWVRRGQ